MQSLRNARTSQVLIIRFVNERTSTALSTMKHADCVLDKNYGSWKKKIIKIMEKKLLPLA